MTPKELKRAAKQAARVARDLETSDGRRVWAYESVDQPGKYMGAVVTRTPGFTDNLANIECGYLNVTRAHAESHAEELRAKGFNVKPVLIDTVALARAKRA